MKRKNFLMSLTLAGALSALGNQAQATSWMDFDDVIRGGCVDLAPDTHLTCDKSNSIFGPDFRQPALTRWMAQGL